MTEEKIQAVSIMQEYIEQHLHEVITMQDLARACNYSVYYAARMFKELCTIAPFEYIRKRRLTEAAKTIQSSSVKIVDVALSFEFATHEGFTRAFAKTFGILPNVYARNPKAIPWFLPHNVAYQSRIHQQKEETMTKDNGKAVFIQIVERPIRKAIIKRGSKATEYFAYCNEVGCDVWGMLCSIKDAIHEPIGMWLPKSLIKPGTSKYVQGVEVSYDYAGEIPEGFELIELESCKMMIFQGEPYPDEDFSTHVSATMKYINGFNPTIYGYEWADDVAPRYQLEPQGYRGYIEARPVVEIR